MKLVKKLIILLIIILLGLGIYKFFFACDKVIIDFNQEFTLKVLDYAKVSDEAYVKLLKITDQRCQGSDCEREGQIAYQLVVLNDMRVQFVTLSTLEQTAIEINKTNYVLELTDGTNLEQGKFRLNLIEEKK